METTAWIERVRAVVATHQPGLRVDDVRPLGAGEDHVAFEVDGRLVVRFRLDDEACAAETAREVELLGVIARVAPVAVPAPAFVVPEECCYGYEKLPGTPLLALPRPESAQRVATSVGDLLDALHALPADAVAHLAPVDAEPAEAWLEEASELYAGVSAHVPAPARAAVESFLAAPAPPDDDALVFSHNDLGIEHVLVDPATGTVTGVIDWSDAAICTPAYDFGLLLRDLGPEALAAALARYERDADRRALTQRAWFFARCACLEDLAYGIETGRAEYADKSLEAMTWLFAAPPVRCGRRTTPRCSPHDYL